MNKFTHYKSWMIIFVAVAIALSMLLLYGIITISQNKIMHSVEILEPSEDAAVLNVDHHGYKSELFKLFGEGEYELPTVMIYYNELEGGKPSEKDIISTEAANIAVELIEKIFDVDLNGASIEVSYRDAYRHGYTTESVWEVDITDKEKAYSYSCVINSVTGHFMEVYRAEKNPIYVEEYENLGIDKYYSNVYKYSGELKKLMDKWINTEDYYVNSIDSRMWAEGAFLYNIYTPHYYNVKMNNGDLYEFMYNEKEGLVSVSYFEDIKYSGIDENNVTRIYSHYKKQG